MSDDVDHADAGDELDAAPGNRRRCVSCGLPFPGYYLSAAGRCFDCVAGEAEQSLRVTIGESSSSAPPESPLPPLPAGEPFTDHQRQIWTDHLERVPQTRTAGRLGVTQQAVSKMLRKMRRRNLKPGGCTP